MLSTALQSVLRTNIASIVNFENSEEVDELSLWDLKGLHQTSLVEHNIGHLSK